MLNMLDDAMAKRLLEIMWEESITGLALVKEDGTFYKANPTFCRITEYTESELRRRKFQDITAPRDLADDVEMARLVAAGEYETYDMNKEYITKTNRIQPVFLRVTALRIDGEFMYFVGEIAPLDRRNEERSNPKILAQADRNVLFKSIKDNLPIILTVLGGIGILVGYATGLLQMKP